ncbi:MAG: hypothetical protein ACK4TA_11435 [Saprospiraceae bacterium]
MVKNFRYIFLFTLLFSVSGLWGEVTSTQSDEWLHFISETKEYSEESEGCNKGYFSEEAKIRQTGAGGSGLEEPDSHAIQAMIAPPAALPLFDAFPTVYFSIQSYYYSLFQSLYLPKLFILYHCTKAFLS